MRAGLLLLLVSAAAAGDDIRVERSGDAVIVRSPIEQANFLFRTSAAFEEADAPEGFAVALAAKGAGGAGAAIRLRLASAPANLDAHVRERAVAYAEGTGVAAEITGEGARRLATARGKERVRLVLVVIDGPRLYELFLDAGAADPLAKELADVAHGFTILDPKGAPVAAAPVGDAKAAEIEHDYYRLKLLKPEGFLRLEVDPNADKGIFLHLRREDDRKSRCDILVRVHLERSVQKDLLQKAQARLDDFLQRYPDAKGPKRPQRTGWPGADEAFKFRLAGKASWGVVEEEWRVIQHGNDRIYEIQVTTWGGAAREWKREIQAFWKGLRIQPK